MLCTTTLFRRHTHLHRPLPLASGSPNMMCISTSWYLRGPEPWPVSNALTSSKQGHTHLKELLGVMHIRTGILHLSPHGGEPVCSLLTNAGHFWVNGRNSQIRCPSHCIRQWQCVWLNSLCVGELGRGAAKWVPAETPKGHSCRRTLPRRVTAVDGRYPEGSDL